MLIDDFKEKCKLMEKQTVSDGAGGFETKYVESIEFECAIVTSATVSQRVAEKTLGKASFQLTVPLDLNLDYHDIIKREDGTFIRCTSESEHVKTPKGSSFQFRQVTGEQYVLS